MRSVEIVVKNNKWHCSFSVSVLVLVCGLLPQQSHARRGDTFDFRIGYTSDSFDWTTAGDTGGGNPNIEHSMNIPDVELVQVSMDVKEKNSSGVVGLLELDYGSMFSGLAQESKYFGDNKSDEYYRRNAEVDGGYSFRASLSFGADFKILSESLVLTPLLGYMINQQKFKFSNGRQVIPEMPSTAVVGKLEDLASRYNAQWAGGWAGVNFATKSDSRFSVSGYLRYYKLEYEADADWDQQSELQPTGSFTHQSDGDGVSMSIELAFKRNVHTEYVVRVQSFSFSSEDGEAVNFNSSAPPSRSRFNGANWDSSAIQIGVKKNF